MNFQKSKSKFKEQIVNELQITPQSVFQYSNTVGIEESHQQKNNKIKQVKNIDDIDASFDQNASHKSSVSNGLGNSVQVLDGKIKQDAFVRKISSNRQTIHQCMLCSQTFKQAELVDFAVCQHKFCSDCLIKYAKEQISKDNKLYCPVKSCGVQFYKNIMNEYLSTQQIQKLQQIIRRKQKKIIQEDIIVDIQDIENENNHSNDNHIQNQAAYDHHDEGEEDIRITQNQQEKSIHNSTPRSRKLSQHEEIQLQLGEKLPSKSPQKIRRKSKDLGQPQQRQSSPIKRLNSSIRLNKLTSKNTNQSGGSDPLINTNIQSPPKGMSSIMFNSEIMKHSRKKLKYKKQEQKRVQTYPQILFKRICTKVWSDKWSIFFLILPVSIFVLIVFVAFALLWFLWVILYFTLMWCISIPMIWAVYEMWGCFNRSIKNQILRSIAFTICLFGFPLIIIFFYFLTLGILLYYSYYKPDMKQLIQGNTSLILSCHKIHLNEKIITKNLCKCMINQKCMHCEMKNLTLCLVI